MTRFTAILCCSVVVGCGEPARQHLPPGEGVAIGNITNFIWLDSSSEGVAVRFAIPDRFDESCTVECEVKRPLSQHWAIASAKLVRFPDGHDDGLPCVYEGPFMTNQSAVNAFTFLYRWCRWNIYSMRDQPYQIEVLLHRLSEDMMFDETVEAIKCGDLLAEFSELKK